MKEQESLEHKLARADKVGKYNKLDDVTDLCGLRIVLFTNEDCEAMSEAISKNFDIDMTNSIIKVAGYAEDRFGYLSTHLIASLPEARLGLFEFRHLANLKMEIQIRTVLQHAWAVLDWKLRYKTEREVPKELRRKLFRISALLEAADEAFSDLQHLAGNLRAEYDSEIRQGKLRISINKDSLQAFLLQSEAVRSIFDKCEQRGIQIARNTSVGSDTAYDYLISSLAACGIDTLDKFEEQLRLVNEHNIDDLLAIANKGPFKFGAFTPLRILMISQIAPEQQLRVIDSFPSAGPIGRAERAYFQRTSKH